MARRRKLRGKKLLIASIGLATLSYVGCGGETEQAAPPGNLVGPPPIEEPEGTPPEDPGGPTDSPQLAPPGNLMPPQPIEPDEDPAPTRVEDEEESPGE